MTGNFFNVSGIDRNDGARIVFVWCRSTGSDDYARLGTGHIVGAEGGYIPPGVTAGQYSVTFPLPYGCSAGNIVVTDDKNGKEFLPDVTVIPCLTSWGVQPEPTIVPREPVVRAGAVDALPQTSQIMMAPTAELES